MAQGSVFRRLRQLTVALVAAALLAGTWLTRARITSWEEPLWVTVYPVYGEDTAQTRQFVAGLGPEDFAPIEQFVAREAAHYGVALAAPVRLELGVRAGLPPAPPADGGPLTIMWWSLKLRWWVARELAARPGPAPDIRLFVVFHEPVDGVALPHSLGLKESQTGIVHAFASRRMQGSNRVVIAHELLHILGATDKYGARNLPRYPDGYAEPERAPLHPQRYAEIMGGRIPTGPGTAEIPADLREVLVGPATAAELNWPGHPDGRVAAAAP